MPSKGAFFLHKAVVTFVTYLILDFSTYLRQPDQKPKLFHPARIPWLNGDNLALEQLQVKTTTVLGLWVDLYCVIQAETTLGL